MNLKNKNNDFENNQLINRIKEFDKCHEEIKSSAYFIYMTTKNKIDCKDKRVFEAITKHVNNLFYLLIKLEAVDSQKEFYKKILKKRSKLLGKKQQE